MKTLNKRLLVTSGLFVAFCGLTSFNPFTQATHLSALEKEESITLAQSTPPAGRQTGRSNGGDATFVSPTMANQLEQGKAKNPPKPKDQPDNSKEDPKKLEQTSAGVPCADGKCESKSKLDDLTAIINDSSLSADEKAAKIAELQKPGRPSSRLDEEESRRSYEFCKGSARDYQKIQKKLSCYKTTLRNIEKQDDEISDELLGRLSDEMELFAEDTLQAIFKKRSKITNRQAQTLLKNLGKLADEAGSDSLDATVENAIAALETESKMQSNANYIAQAAQTLPMLEQQTQYACSQGLQYSCDSASMQLYSYRNQVFGEIATAQKTANTSRNYFNDTFGDSSFAQIIDARLNQSYQMMISPLASYIQAKDPRLTELEISSASIASYQSQQNNQYSQNGLLNRQNGMNNYNSMNPNGVSGVPALPQSLRSGNYNVTGQPYGNTNMPIVGYNNNNQQLPNGMSPYRLN